LQAQRTLLNNNTPDWQPWLGSFVWALQPQKRRLAAKAEREKSTNKLTTPAVKILGYARLQRMPP